MNNIFNKLFPEIVFRKHNLILSVNINDREYKLVLPKCDYARRDKKKIPKDRLPYTPDLLEMIDN